MSRALAGFQNNHYEVEGEPECSMLPLQANLDTLSRSYAPQVR